MLGEERVNSQHSMPLVAVDRTNEEPPEQPEQQHAQHSENDDYGCPTGFRLVALLWHTSHPSYAASGRRPFRSNLP